MDDGESTPGDSFDKQGKAMIREIQKKDIYPFINDCKAEGLCFNMKMPVIYYGYFNETELIGFMGVIYYRRKAYLKNIYVLPSWRRRGIYSVLNEYVLDCIREKGYKIIEANFTDKALPLYLKRGARIIKEYRNCKKVIYENL